MPRPSSPHRGSTGCGEGRGKRARRAVLGKRKNTAAGVRAGGGRKDGS
ncbi:hypothetical protein [Lysobacter gummosus]